MPMVLNHSGNDEIRIEKSLGKNLPKVIADFGRIQISVTNVVISEEEARFHDGFIDVISQSEKGTSVCIYLPAVGAPKKSVMKRIERKGMFLSMIVYCFVFKSHVTA